MPLVLMYKGEVLVSNDKTPLPFGFLVSCMILATCFRRRFLLVSLDEKCPSTMTGTFGRC
jgi:hypothetical protein